jgi:DNA-binding LytR/AlgR family response regulator
MPVAHVHVVAGLLIYFSKDFFPFMRKIYLAKGLFGRLLYSTTELNGGHFTQASRNHSVNVKNVKNLGEEFNGNGSGVSRNGTRV